MALNFNEQTGSAVKEAVDAVAFKDGENMLRIVGDILPRYVYWVKGLNGKNIPFECLSFDRTKEKFTNVEKDWVKEYYPDMKCGWAYATQAIVDGKLKVVNLKKKLWLQVISAAADGLGDPTDVETGWPLCFKKVKTGPQVFNVEYQLQALKCKTHQGPLSAEDKALLSELKSMDEVLPRPTADAQKELLERIRNDSSKPEATDDEAIDAEFQVS